MTRASLYDHLVSGLENGGSYKHKDPYTSFQPAATESTASYSAAENIAPDTLTAPSDDAAIQAIKANPEKNPEPEHPDTSLTVSALANAIRHQLEDIFGFVRVRGEVTGLKVHGSGHVYFSLKDDQAVLASVCWRGMAQRLSFVPQDGMEIIAQGRLTTYGGRSQYQLVVSQVEHAGVGALLKLLEERRLKLHQEGLFDKDRKLPLPFLPDLIGVITSPTGAVIRDIIHRIEDRCPRHILIWPVAVQGEAAAKQITEAVEGFQKLPRRPDVILLARGGGSLEDLWCFNEESVVRAVAMSTIPIISAVGHETDTTLVDFAASLRAPTPTASAEMAVPVKSDLLLRIGESRLRCQQSLLERLKGAKTHLSLLHRALEQPQRIIDPHSQYLDDLTDRLPLAVHSTLTRAQLNFSQHHHRLRPPTAQLYASQHKHAALTQRLQVLLESKLHTLKSQLWHHQTRLDPKLLAWELTTKSSALQAQNRLLMSLSYKSVLKRGYALVTTPSGNIISTALMAKQQKNLEVQFYDGTLQVMPTTTPTQDNSPTSVQQTEQPTHSLPNRRPKKSKKPVAGPLLPHLFD